MQHKQLSTVKTGSLFYTPSEVEPILHLMQFTPCCLLMCALWMGWVEGIKGALIWSIRKKEDQDNKTEN